MLYRYIVCVASILFQEVLILYVTRVFTVCLPYEKIPWCGPQSKIEYISMLVQLLLVAFNNFDISNSIALLEVIVLFLL